MAADLPKWDVNVLLRLCRDGRFCAEDVTFTSADAMLKAISEIVVVVSAFPVFYNVM